MEGTLPFIPERGRKDERMLMARDKGCEDYEGKFTKYTTATGMDLVNETHEQLGYRIEPIGYKIFVRTMPHEKKKGLLWLPPKLQSFHGETLAHLVIVRATVLSCGPRGLAATIEPGEIVEFQRLHFGFVEKLFGGGTVDDPFGEVYVGFLDSNQLLWKMEADDD